MARLEVEEGAADGGADEHANARDAEAHADARADLAEVWGERDEGARGQRDERAGEEAVEDRKDDEGPGAAHGGPCDEERATQKRDGDECVEGAYVVRERGGCEAAEKGGGVEDGHEVEGECRACVGLGQRKGRDVEEGVV